MMKTIHQIIFDFDYTLADSSEGVIASVNYALKESGHDAADPEAVRQMIGHSLEDTFGCFIDPAQTDIIQRCKRMFMEYADTGVMLQKTILLEGTEPTIKALYENLFTLGIVSTKRRSTIEETLIQFELDDYFDVIIGYEDVINLKPNPEGLLKAIELTAGMKEDTVYVGDSLVDVETAKRAGVFMIGVTTGKTGKQELISAGADLVVPDISALLTILK
jgi:phosphoglycolate phosphatase